MSAAVCILGLSDRQDDIAKNVQYWFKKKNRPNAALRMALFRANGAKGRCADLTRFAKAWRSKDQTSNGMARKSLEKKWLWMQGVALISNGKAWSRSESQRQSGVENSNALKRADLQWHGIDMPRYGEKINERG